MAAQAQTQSNSLPFYARLVVAVLVVMVMAQSAPKAVNNILVLVLVGIFLNHYGAFNQIFTILSSVGSK